MTANEWDDLAAHWDDDPRVGSYAAHAYDSLTAYADLSSLRVLDFGCGTGTLTRLLSRDARTVVALDGSAAMIRQVNKKAMPNVRTIEGFLTPELIESEPQLNDRFDLITASSVCAFLPDYAATLALLRTLLRPAGMFVQWDWQRDIAGEGIGFSEEELRRSLSVSGFRVDRIDRPFVVGGEDGDMPVIMAVAINP